MNSLSLTKYLGLGTLLASLMLSSTVMADGPVEPEHKAKPAKIEAARDQAQEQAQETAIDSDPLEPLNRAIYEFNHGFDVVALRPITEVYRFIVPEQGREMVSNALANIYTPVTFANSVLQADIENSFVSFWRFLINSTFGIGGLFDVASEAGLKGRTADFGETLAMYGMGTGPYIVLPIIGPSNARDAVGRLADAFINPFNYVDQGFSIALWSATAIDKRSENMQLLDDIYDSSLDPYATFRSGYQQKRASDIRRGMKARETSWKKLCTTH